MMLINTSWQTGKAIQPLVDYVMAFSAAHNRAVILHVTNGLPKCSFSGGVAKRDQLGDVFVEVYLALPKNYPVLNRHPIVREVGWIEFHSWEEEFVFILAHELRHVQQFVFDCYDPDREKEMEVDAEMYAYAILTRYRAGVQAYAVEEAA